MTGDKFHIRLSIVHKLMLYVILLVFFAVGVTTYLMVKQESKVLTEALTYAAKHTAKSIASSTESAFWSLNWIFVEQLLKEISEDQCSEVIFAKVVNPNGEVYLADDKAYYGETVDSSLLFDKETLLDRHYFSEQGEEGILLIHPVAIGKDKWYILLGLTLEPVRKKIRDLIVRNVGLGGLILLLAIIALFFLSRSISGPLGRLSNSAKAIAAGDPDQSVEVKSRDEIGLLGDAFNEMVKRLNDAKVERESFGQKYQTLVTTVSKAGVGIIVVQNDSERKWIIRYVNQGMVDLSGYETEELLRMTMKNIVHPDDYGRLSKLYSKEFSEAALRDAHQFRGVNKKGEIIWIEISVGATDFDGRRALVCYARDVSKRLEIEAALKAYNENLEMMVLERTSKLKDTLTHLQDTQSQLLQSEKMATIGQLAAGVAHEINNPVGFVKSNLGTMREYCEDLVRLLAKYQELETVLASDMGSHEKSSVCSLLETLSGLKEEIDLDFVLDDYQKAVDESLEGMERVAKIVSDLKDFSHIDKAELEETDINRGIESTLDIVWNELKYKVDVTKDLGDIPLVKCYSQRLNQVFMNILVNGAQAIEKKGEIRITTRARDDNVEIKFSDTGKGIPPDILPKIFDPFFTTKDVGKGTGLGLNVAYNIIRKHKGSIHVESEVGKGTRFTIRLKVDPGAIE
ncbi:MAG: HAMP domain-containing protein [Deltaproteobacteria bacterium]|nr:HAMP domain-containing protein [Deltaproteobacteria bacterium]